MKHITASFVLAALVLLLLALPLLHADASNGGGGGWGENVQVQVLDLVGRPVPNALVNISWEISKTRGSSATKTLRTDSGGMASFLLDNIEFNANDTNYSFIVNAYFGHAYASQIFNANCWSSLTGTCTQNGVMLPPNPALEPRTLNLKAFLVTFVVRDRNDQPLSVPIRVDDTYNTRSDAGGMAHMELDNGTHWATVTYFDLKKTVNFTVTADGQVNVSMHLYNLGVQVLDDNAQPLTADVYASSSSQQTDAKGWAYFANLSDSQPLVNVYYGRHSQSVSVNLAAGNTTTILFDVHPPVISNVQSQWDGNHLQVRASITDPGSYASGLSGGNASIDIYYIASDGVQHNLPMYAVGRGLYEGLIPLPGGVQQVRYTVQAMDAAGNSGSSSDTFVVPTSAQNSSDQNSPPPVQNPNGGLSGWIVPGIGLLLLLVLGGGGYYYYKNKKPPTQEENTGWTDKTGGSAAASPAAPASPGSFPNLGSDAPPAAPASPPVVPPREPPPIPPSGPSSPPPL